MIETEKNMLSGMMSAKCVHCNRQIMIMTLTPYYCSWCSEPIPNYRLLSEMEYERVNYHKNKRVFNVNVKS
jgi:DNA-directed RNA polymerase subunit RPC12/RpoP